MNQVRWSRETSKTCRVAALKDQSWRLLNYSDDQHKNITLFLYLWLLWSENRSFSETFRFPGNCDITVPDQSRFTQESCLSLPAFTSCCFAVTLSWAWSCNTNFKRNTPPRRVGSIWLRPLKLAALNRVGKSCLKRELFSYVSGILTKACVICFIKIWTKLYFKEQNSLDQRLNHHQQM